MTKQPTTDTMDEQLNKIRSKFEKKMGDAWEKYDSSGIDADLEEYGEDYEKAYDYLFDSIRDLMADFAERITPEKKVGRLHAETEWEFHGYENYDAAIDLLESNIRRELK